MVAGVVYNPATDDLFIAERGQGAFHNDRRLRVAGRRLLEDAVVCTTICHIGRGDHGRNQAEIRAVASHVAGIRRFGSAALELAYVAAGRLDGFWERWLSPWDMGAGIALVREAGGFVSDFRGRSEPIHSTQVLAANDALHGLQQPRLARDRGAGREVQRRAFGAQAAEVGGVLGVAAHAGDLVAVRFDDDAAAYAAVGAGGAGLPHHASSSGCFDVHAAALTLALS
eukprot:gene2933-3857_t